MNSEPFDLEDVNVDYFYRTYTTIIRTMSEVYASMPDE